DEAKEFLNRIPVNAFMRSLDYMTDLAALLHQEALAKAFAIPSYETSVRSYRTFVRYFGRDSGGFILNGPVSEQFWDPFGKTLRAFNQRGLRFELLLRKRVRAIEVDGRSRSPRVKRICVVSADLTREWRDVENLIVAVPHAELAALIEQSPELAAIEAGRALL